MVNDLKQNSLHRGEVGCPGHIQLFTGCHFAAHRLDGESRSGLGDGDLAGILGVGIVVISDDNIAVLVGREFNRSRGVTVLHLIDNLVNGIVLTHNNFAGGKVSCPAHGQLVTTAHFATNGLSNKFRGGNGIEFKGNTKRIGRIRSIHLCLLTVNIDGHIRFVCSKVIAVFVFEFNNNSIALTGFKFTSGGHVEPVPNAAITLFVLRPHHFVDDDAISIALHGVDGGSRLADYGSTHTFQRNGLDGRTLDVHTELVGLFHNLFILLRIDPQGDDVGTALVDVILQIPAKDFVGSVGSVIDFHTVTGDGNTSACCPAFRKGVSGKFLWESSKLNVGGRAAQIHGAKIGILVGQFHGSRCGRNGLEFHIQLSHHK